MSEYSQTYSTRVASTPAACFAVLTDFAAYPEWSSPVRICRVLTRHPDGLPHHVEFQLDMTIKTLRYVLAYEYDPPHTARWQLVEGDVAGVEGAYRFDDADGGTTATCTQAIDLGFWVPGFLRRTFEQKALHDSVEEFRRAVETRAG